MKANNFCSFFVIVILFCSCSYSFGKELSNSENDASKVDSVIITFSNTVPIEEKIGEIRIYTDKMYIVTYPIFADNLLRPGFKTKLDYNTNLVANDYSDNQLLRILVNDLFVFKKYKIIKSKIKTDYKISHSNPKKIDVTIYKKGESENSTIKYEYSILGQNISVIDGYEVHYERHFIMFYDIIYNLFKEARSGIL